MTLLYIGQVRKHGNDVIVLIFLGPPSKVQNLTFVYRDQTSVVLAWEAPRDLGGRRDIEYGIQCINCSDRVVYSPRKAGFNSTRYFSDFLMDFVDI